jgi:tetratricopeptide (TPR) repeat protein
VRRLGGARLLRESGARGHGPAGARVDLAGLREVVGRQAARGAGDARRGRGGRGLRGRDLRLLHGRGRRLRGRRLGALAHEEDDAHADEEDEADDAEPAGGARFVVREHVDGLAVEGVGFLGMRGGGGAHGVEECRRIAAESRGSARLVDPPRGGRAARGAGEALGNPAPVRHTPPMIPSEAGADPALTCAAAEEALHRGEIEAHALGDAALAAARARSDRALEAVAHQILGEIDYDDLSYAPALAHLDTAIGLREELLGSSDDATRRSYAMRSIVLFSEDRLADSDRDLERAAVGRTLPASPDDAAENARLWVTLGAAYATRERYVEARPLLEAVLASESTGKLSPYVTANTCVHLGMLFEHLGDSKRATVLHERVIAIRRAVIGTPSLRVALSLSTHATCLMNDGRLEEGRALMLESVSMLEACGRADHPRASVVYLGVAVAELMSGHGPASEAWLARAIDRETRTFGPAHANTGKMISTAAVSYAARGFHGRAVDLAQRAAAILVQHPHGRGGEALETVVAQGFMSLRELKRHDAIVKWLEPLLAKLDRVEPPPEKLLGPVLNMIGEGYFAAGRLAKAEAALRRSLAMAERVYGETSEEVRVVLHNLQNLLKKQRRTDEARAVEAREQQVVDTLEGHALSPFRNRWKVGSA